MTKESLLRHFDLMSSLLLSTVENSLDESGRKAFGEMSDYWRGIILSTPDEELPQLLVTGIVCSIASQSIHERENRNG